MTKYSALATPAEIAEDNDLLTVSEVATSLRVDDTTVRRWIKNGILEAITLPHAGERQSYRIKRATLETVLHTTQPSQTA